MKERTKKSFFHLVKKIPYIKNKIDEELGKTRQEFEETFHKAAKGQSYLQTLPARGLTEVTYLVKQFEVKCT